MQVMVMTQQLNSIITEQEKRISDAHLPKLYFQLEQSKAN